MNKIITLTVNPALDKSTSVSGIKPNSKLRCEAPVFEAGGGGINVSRVLHELGETSLCMYMAGGPSGTQLKNLLVEVNILQQIIPIQGWTRENLAVTDTLNNQQYRFGMPGPQIMADEWQKTLVHLEAILMEGDFLVASGSLSPGMPLDFYRKVAKIAQKKKTKLILDTSGEALLQGAKEGVYLLKPNLGELAALIGVETIFFSELDSLVKKFLQTNPCEVLVVSLGAQGAILFTKTTVEHIMAPIVKQKSTIGAGDSMVAGIVLALSQGKKLKEMVQYGVACGTAATMTEGTQLCKKTDVDELFKWIVDKAAKSNTLKINA